MNSASAISVGRAKTEIATPERQFEVFQGAAGLTAIREDWNRITRALDKPRFFHLYEWYESYAGGGPLFYRLLAAAPGPLIRAAIGLRRWIRN